MHKMSIKIRNPQTKVHVSNMKNTILSLVFLSFNYLNAFVNGNFDGDDSAWTIWIVGGEVEVDLAQMMVQAEEVVKH